MSEAWWSSQVNLSLLPGTMGSASITRTDATPGEYLISATVAITRSPSADQGTGFARCQVPGSQSISVTPSQSTNPILGRATVSTPGPLEVTCTSSFPSGEVGLRVYAQSLKVDTVR